MEIINMPRGDLRPVQFTVTDGAVYAADRQLLR